MRVSSTEEAGAFIARLREQEGLSRKELSEASGIPLRTVYAVEKGELNNLSIDRIIALLDCLGAHLDIAIDEEKLATSRSANKSIDQAMHTIGAGETWGIWS